jgi:cytoskeletal protein CcmA (bactofilin family)
VLVGDIEGVESLSSFYIEGTVEGNVNLPGTHVIVGRSGKVSAGIVARTILVNGAVTGNVTASERLEVRAGASLTGDAIAPRVIIEDGALVRGSVLITKDAEELAAVIQMVPATKSRKNADARQDSQIPMMVPALRSA